MTLPTWAKHSADLCRLASRYVVSLDGPYLLLDGVPYRREDGSNKCGTLISVLYVQGEGDTRTTRPPTGRQEHMVYWIGENPFRANKQSIFGSPNVKQIQLSGSSRDVLWFSRKPPDGYTDHYHKLHTYYRLISQEV